MNGCPRCGARMAMNDETIKLEGMGCPRCHATIVDRKHSTRDRT